MTVKKDLHRVAELSKEALSAADDPARLAALLSEMQALADVLPAEAAIEGLAERASAPLTHADVVARSEEEAVEAGFDNLPI